ncbi:MAG: phosphoenolpyruvate carboxykinase (ATP) [Paludibacter sp.]|nr:phosphoenolpyruvate carboxykinase (ATP) [Paludibacter sp.]
MQDIIQLNIADFLVNLHSEFPVELESGYFPFISNPEIGKADVDIYSFIGIPENPFYNYQLVFEAENAEQKFYSIYKSNNELRFIMYDQQNVNQVQQIAYLNADFSEWKIYNRLEPDIKPMPLKYPMGPIMMHYLTQKCGAVMMHASNVYDGEKGRIFTGFSGNGKSTMSKIWADAGNLVINDDRVIIRRNEDGYFVYNTPMFYQDVPKKAPLHAIYLISHAPANKIKKLAGALAVSRVMAFCIQNNFEKQLIQNHLNFFGTMCHEIPVFDLGFVPDAGVIDCILKHGI